MTLWRALAGGVVLALGTFSLDLKPFPYISGSRIVMHAGGYYAPYRLELLGPGRIDGSTVIAPSVNRPTTITVVAAGRFAAASARLRIVPGPRAHDSLIAVASYENGIVLHDPVTYAIVGVQPIDGNAGDVAFGPDGMLFAPDTDGDTLAQIMRSPWHERPLRGVSAGNEVAVDSHGVGYITDRDVAGKGALTRVDRNGTTVRVVTGITAEGLALDELRHGAYVGNVNDASVLEVDTKTMRARRRIRAVDRVFGIALDARRRRLFVVSNTSGSMPGGPGFAEVIDLAKPGARVVARSSRMTFPLGIALEASTHRAYVTDEGADVVYVLDQSSLRPQHAPLHTCSTPWRPFVDARRARLYVPCARAGRLEVFDTRTLSRIHGSPFLTGGFPLGVSAWK